MKVNHVPNKTKMRVLKIVLGGAVLVGLGAGRMLMNIKPKALKAVENVDLSKFSGKWYEIARKPVTIERRSFKNIVTQYSRIDEEKLKVEWHYTTGEGKIGQLFGEATIENAPANSKFKISYLPEFLHAFRAKSYLIFRLDPQYKIALIGNKQRTHFWLLSRDRHLDTRVVDDYLTFAKEQGFKLNDLIYVEHT